jgi:SAM-dependent methyltransferase
MRHGIEQRPSLSVRSSERYQGSEGEAYFAWQRDSAKLSALLDPPVFQPYVGPGDTVLDFGCGTGALLAVLASGPKLGVEANEAARREAARAGITVVAGTDALDPESVDVVISNHALEHVLDPLSELRLLNLALRPGGTLVLRLPLDDWRSQRRPGDDGNHHLYTWTPRLISNLLEEAGFDVQEARVVAYAWPPRAAMLIERLPRVVFDALAGVTAVVLRRRQLLVIGHRPAQRGPAAAEGENESIARPDERERERG